MKKITYIIAFAAVLAAACQKNEVAEEPASDPQYNKILTAGVADEPLTRVGFDDISLPGGNYPAGLDNMIG